MPRALYEELCILFYCSCFVHQKFVSCLWRSKAVLRFQQRPCHPNTHTHTHFRISHYQGAEGGADSDFAQEGHVRKRHRVSELPDGLTAGETAYSLCLIYLHAYVCMSQFNLHIVCLCLFDLVWPRFASYMCRCVGLTAYNCTCSRADQACTHPFNPLEAARQQALM
jgi:hypothetical protein